MTAYSPEHVRTRIRFATIWNNYPRFPPCLDKDGNVPRGWENQCAIRVGEALERSGVSFKSLTPGGRCPRTSDTGAMIGNASTLANWLKTQPFPGCGRTQTMTGAVWKETVAQKTGIIFFKDYWRRHGETHGAGSGDHIDLWNRDSLTPGIVSFLRFRLNIGHVPNLNLVTRSADNQNWFSDLSNSSEVWFWPVL